ncbi:hypothetical protein [Aureivirga sp. CE67]|uniref:hypothetical protein n=1 Tax=Aureivirga sp. CE67 TaxID=1788983 RepID=UPI0018C9BCC5|nr:hypothetical protein [Aureivirga sp. CE67]
MRVITDLFLVASNASTAPAGPEGYILIGCWDVDSGGSVGTKNSRGTGMMALYAEHTEVESLEDVQHIENVFLTASNDPKPIAPNGKNYENIGYWAVDGGGSVGTNGSTGNRMMGMYISKTKGGKSYINDVQLTASDDPFPINIGDRSNYFLTGYWDVDVNGAHGTNNNSFGTYMAGLFVRYTF